MNELDIKHLHFDELDSTNEKIKELLSDNEILVITADNQTAGHGRSGRKWIGNPGENLYCSIGIMHKEPPGERKLSLLQALGCLAAKSALMRIAPDAIFAIKYPNDVVTKYRINSKRTEWRKICGILVEHSFWGEKCICSVVGIGINCKQKDFPRGIKTTAASLYNVGYDIEPSKLIVPLVEYFKELLHFTNDEIFSIWKEEVKMEDKSITLLSGKRRRRFFFEKEHSWIVKKVLSDCRLEIMNTATGFKKIIDNGDSIRYEID